MLLVCNVADKQVGGRESAMQAAMGGHMSVAAYTELNYLQMETSFVAGPTGFSTLVHVPLIDMKSALTIWEHHILPLPLETVFGASSEQHLPKASCATLREKSRFEEDTRTKYNFWWPLT